VLAQRHEREIVSTQLLDAPFLFTALGRIRSNQPARDSNAEKLGRQREKLEGERQRLLRMTLKGACSEDDFVRESKRIEAEILDLDRLQPAPTPAAFDPAKPIARTTRTFARFAKQPFEEKRKLLRMAVREIVLDDGTIPSVTFNGAFVERVNLSTRSRPLYDVRGSDWH
jgi:hypothetical protein